jgi:hypothetical protein
MFYCARTGTLHATARRSGYYLGWQPGVAWSRNFTQPAVFVQRPEPFEKMLNVAGGKPDGLDVAFARFGLATDGFRWVLEDAEEWPIAEVLTLVMCMLPAVLTFVVVWAKVGPALPQKSATTILRAIVYLIVFFLVLSVLFVLPIKNNSVARAKLILGSAIRAYFTKVDKILTI